jgi:hypothetical protein
MEAPSRAVVIGHSPLSSHAWSSKDVEQSTFRHGVRRATTRVSPVKPVDDRFVDRQRLVVVAAAGHRLFFLKSACAWGQGLLEVQGPHPT